MAFDMGLAHAAFSMRCFGCIVSLPLGETLSLFPRFLLAVGLSVVLFTGDTASEPLSPFTLITEFVIGFVLGAPLRFVSDISEMIGELIDTARGQMVSAVLDPLHGHGGSDLATVAKLSSVVVALTCGALEVVVSALARSAEFVPLGGSAHSPSLLLGFARSAVFLLSEGMMMCAVWVGAFLLIDLASGVLSRVMNGLTFIQAGAILKMLVALLLLVVFMTQGASLSKEKFSRVIAPWGWRGEPVTAPSASGGLRGSPGGLQGGR
jgi:flagellar biosynthesis protein FliR